MNEHMVEQTSGTQVWNVYTCTCKSLSCDLVPLSYIELK